MTFTFNFVSQACPEPGPTIAQLIASRHWTRELVVVKLNGENLPGDRFDEVRVAEGDRLETFFLVSGG